MRPVIPQGGEATSAWRALHPQARVAAWDAARRGAATPDPSLGIVAAGYGQTVARRLFFVQVAAPAALLAVLVVGIVVLAVAGVPADLLMRIVVPVVVVGYVAGMLAVRVQRRRFQRLHTSGMLAMEAMLAGAPVPAAGWSTPYQSSFTVPYQGSGYPPPAAQQPAAPYQPPGYPVAPQPAAYPAAPYRPAPPAQPAAYPGAPAQVLPGPQPGPGPGPAVPAAPVEIRVRRSAILVSLGVLGLVAVLFWFRVALYTSLTAGSGQGMSTTMVVLASGYTVAIAALAVIRIRPLLKPLVARFTPEGWQLPGLGVQGGWTQVREIRVRTAAVRRSPVFFSAATGVRVVALILDEPANHAAPTAGSQRRAARRAQRRYGSPAIIVASPRVTIGVLPLIGILQRYTAAPVNWG